MSLQVEYIDNSHIQVNCEIAPEVLSVEVQKIFNSLRKAGRIRLPGFRSSKVTYEMACRIYGHGFLMQDAIPNAAMHYLDDALMQEYLQMVGTAGITDMDLDAAVKGESVNVSMRVQVEPVAEIATCDVKIPAIDRTVTEAEVSKYIEREQLNNARFITVEDRAAEMGDFVTMDYEFAINGEKTEDTARKDVRIELGQNNIIPGFDEQIVGVNAGDHRDFTIHMPEDDKSALAGKEISYSVDVKLVQRRELPELDDEFAQDVSDCETFEQFMEEIKGKLAEQKEQNAASNRANAALTSLVAGTKVTIPDELVQLTAQEELARIEKTCKDNNLTKEIYAQYFLGIPAEMLPQYAQMNARSELLRDAALRAVAKAQQITVSEEEYQAQLAKEAESVKVEVNKMEQTYPGIRRFVTLNLCLKKAQQYVIDHAEEIEGYVIPQMTDENSDAQE